MGLWIQSTTFHIIIITIVDLLIVVTPPPINRHCNTAAVVFVAEENIALRRDIDDDIDDECWICL